MSTIEFCSQGATWAMFSPSLRNSVTSWVATGSLTVPESATQAELSRSNWMAAFRLDSVPSTSMAECWTGRPRNPPRLLMSCQAAREPIRKSLATSCCALDASKICATVIGRPGVRPGWAQAVQVVAKTAAPANCRATLRLTALGDAFICEPRGTQRRGGIRTRSMA